MQRIWYLQAVSYTHLDVYKRQVRDGRKFATQADFEESIEVVIAGYQKKNRVLSNKEKLIVAYHEIGHALVAAKQTESCLLYTSRCV